MQLTLRGYYIMHEGEHFKTDFCVRNSTALIVHACTNTYMQFLAARSR